MGENRYQKLLADLRNKVAGGASEFIPKMYRALRDEGKKPSEARIIIEHDLGDLLAKRTILSHLPSECKDQTAQELGERGGKNGHQFTKETIAAESAAKGGNTNQVILTDHKNESAKTPEGKILVDENEFRTLRMREYNLNKQTVDMANELKNLKNELKTNREITTGLQQTIQNLKSGRVPEPKEFKQVTLDKFLPAMKEVIHVAHNERCPASCKTWKQARSIDLPV